MTTEYKVDGYIMTCGTCGYIYNHRYDGTVSVGSNKQFVELCEPVLYEKQREYESNTVHRLTQYVCPKCGTIQVDINDL